MVHACKHSVRATERTKSVCTAKARRFDTVRVKVDVRGKHGGNTPPGGA
jgi:hypothetical protein